MSEQRSAGFANPGPLDRTKPSNNSGNYFTELLADIERNQARIGNIRPKAQSALSRQLNRTSTKFIKGPIPLNWLVSANALPGKSGQVGIALWFLSGVRRSLIIKLTAEVELIAGCKRKAVYFALRQLESQNLIKVERSSGSRPTIEIVSSDPTHPQSISNERPQS
jgi:hypothetical protein